MSSSSPPPPEPVSSTPQPPTNNPTPPPQNPTSSSSSNPTPQPQASHPPQTHQNTTFQTFLTSAISATNPSLRHLASHSTLSSLSSQKTTPSLNPSTTTRRTGRSFRPLSTNFEEQRYSGKNDVAITRTTRPFMPDLTNFPTNTSIPTYPEKVLGLGFSQENQSDDVDGTTLFSYGGARESGFVNSGEVVAGGSLPNDGRLNSSKYKEIEIPSSSLISSGNGGMGEGLEQTGVSVGGGEGGVHGRGEEENIYPSAIGVAILITGIALSVFLISLDRTIITTAIPFISREFSSYSDIGWYGSSYLLTASAFQPLYGRIFTLFNMKWAYLTSLFMFELGSLICGVAPNSVTLIIGRAIAGLGSAGILTGSFVVVAHAVRIERRPVMTAVVGLMFGVGATVGPLLGGVFTDLVTWRWCFYFNLPIGGATAIAMIFFFHPPKHHQMMSKSFFYRLFELDIIGNVILLAASIMLFLALQFTEEGEPWGSAEVIGLLVGCGLTFIVFCIWMWWKADGALIPPRIIGQRTVLASCLAGFFIYSAILIQTYYLPIYFQAIKGRSAIGSGVDMIPYVVANAIFSLLAGIFVSKNGYFVVPAVVGMVIGTVGCGLVSTFGRSTGTGMWIGYEILVSAGIGMAIQQGFTAVQIVLPLDEVAIGTAAVVAFQSLGGAVFVSVGNTILQNSLKSAGDSGRLPGVNIQSVIDAGAAGFRSEVPAAELDAVLDVYSEALRKVFIAAIPMAGLAVVACLFLERRSINEKRGGGDVENWKKAGVRREETEKAILEKSRLSRLSVGTNGSGGSWAN